MQELIQPITTGVTAFIATNIDDILILVLFFAQTNHQANHQANHLKRKNQFLRSQEIIAGQYLGFGVLILASLPGFLGGFMVPRPWLGWLGLVPLAIGLSSLLKKSETETDLPTVNNTVTNTFTNQEKKQRLVKLISPQIYQVATVTVGNGGDNIGIYVPLFANSTLPQLLIILAVFFVMIALWCGIAYSLTCHPLVLRALDHYGNAIVPLVFIALGIYIFLESETYKLFGIQP